MIDWLIDWLITSAGGTGWGWALPDWSVYNFKHIHLFVWIKARQTTRSNVQFSTNILKFNIKLLQRQTPSHKFRTFCRRFCQKRKRVMIRMCISDQIQCLNFFKVIRTAYASLCTVAQDIYSFHLALHWRRQMGIQQGHSQFELIQLQLCHKHLLWSRRVCWYLQHKVCYWLHQKVPALAGSKPKCVALPTEHCLECCLPLGLLTAVLI